MQNVNTVAFWKTPHFWLSILTIVASIITAVQTSNPEIGWLGSVLGIVHAIMPLFSAPVSLAGGTITIPDHQ